MLLRSPTSESSRFHLPHSEVKVCCPTKQGLTEVFIVTAYDGCSCGSGERRFDRLVSHIARVAPTQSVPRPWSCLALEWLSSIRKPCRLLQRTAPFRPLKPTPRAVRCFAKIVMGMVSPCAVPQFFATLAVQWAGGWTLCVGLRGAQGISMLFVTLW